MMNFFNDEIVNYPSMLTKPRPGYQYGYEKPIDFKCFIETFKFQALTPLIKDSIALTPGDELSPAIQKILGMDNITHIHGIDEAHLPYVFEAFIDHEATDRLMCGYRKEPVVRLTRLENISSFCLKNNKLIWRMPNSKEEYSGGWADYISIVFNISLLDSIATLARMINTHISNFFIPTKQWNRNINYEISNLRVDIPDYLPLRHLSYGDCRLSCIDGSYIFDHSGNKIGAIAKYEFDGYTFCFPASICGDKLCIGLTRPIACLLNQHLIDKNPGSTILFCQDMRTALSIQKLFDEVRGYDPSQFIVTSHLGTDLNILPWNYLHGHDVVLIPAPSKVSLSRVKLYMECITGVHATSFRVFPGFLLHSPPGTELALARENLPSMEAALLRDTMVINDMGMPLREAQRIIEKSISYDSFIKWGQDLEFFRKSNESVSPGARSEVQPLPPADPSEKPSSPQKLGDVVLHHFIRPGTSVEVLGSKNAGKTQFALSICAALRQNGYLCSIFRNAAQTLCNVAYIDAETLLDEFQENLKQYQLDNDAGFFGLCKFDNEMSNIFPTVSLMNQEFRDGLRNFLLEKKCRYVVLDNLTALMGNRVDYGDAAQEVIEWVELLQNDGICTIFIHHLGGDYQGKARGSKIFTIRARTIITLTGKNEILRDPDVAESIKTSARQDGLTVGLRFDTCKTGALLEGKVFYAHLPFGASHWEYLGVTGADGQQIDFPLGKPFPGAEEAHSTPADGISPEKLKTLSPDQRRVVEILQNNPEKLAVIREKTGWSEDKIRGSLRFLIEAEFVCKEGNGKKTYYALKNRV